MKRDVGGINTLTQEDSGYYDLRKKDNALLSRTLLRVKGDDRNSKEAAHLPD